MLMILAIAAGGAIGSVLRHLTSKGMIYMLGTGFPYGTMFVNIVGSFIMGVLVALFAAQMNASSETRAFLTVGFLGGYTTFSSFSLDVVTLWERGDVGLAFIYTMASVTLSIAALFAGMFLVRSINA